MESVIRLVVNLDAIFRSAVTHRARDWGARATAATIFMFLGVATIFRVRTIVAPGVADPEMLSRLAATGCQTVFYMLMIWFTLIRGTPLKQAAGWQPRLSALLGTFLVFAFGALHSVSGMPSIWHWIAATLLLLGSALSALVVLPRLGKSFSLMAESRQLVTAGPYRFVRHPLYLVEEIAAVGAFMEVLSYAAALILLVQFAFQIRRIYNEEAVLESTFPQYAAYRQSTARLLPGIW